MPEIIAEVDEFSLSVSTPKNGDKANGASIKGLSKPLTNRTRWLKGQVDAMGTRAGVTRIREAATKAALLALAGVVSGDWAYLLGVGLYRFTAGAVAGGAEPMVFEAPAQGGRWVNAALNHDGAIQGGPVWANTAGAATVKGLAADVMAAKQLGVTEGATFAGPITKTSGGFTKERVTLGPDADATWSPNAVDVVVCYGATVNRTYTLLGDPAKHHGAVIRVAVPNTVAADLYIVDGNNANVNRATLGNAGVTSPGYHFGTFLFQTFGTPVWSRIG